VFFFVGDSVYRLSIVTPILFFKNT